jgi:hypothetical protein
VAGLALVVAGLVVTAVVLLLAPPSVAGIAVALPLLVAGVGGGWVISPNTTMTLRSVPVRMAGSAGGALQTGQRIGSAIGTAGLAAVFYTVLAGTTQQVAVAVSLGAAALAVALALVVGVVEWRRDRATAAAGGDDDADDRYHHRVHAHHH